MNAQQAESIHQRARSKLGAASQARWGDPDSPGARGEARERNEHSGSLVLQYGGAGDGAPPLWPLEPEIASFLTDREARSLSGRTIQFYGSELATWCCWLRVQGILCVEAITPHVLRSWLLHLGQRRNPGGIHASYRAIRAFMRWLWEEHDLELKNPVTRVEPPRVPETCLQPIALDDLKAMLGTCGRRSFTDNRDRALMLALLDTGCRAMEFLSLSLGDVDLAVGAVTVRHGKGGKQRVTFLGTRSRRALRRYLRHRPDRSEDEPLWVTVRNSRLGYSGLRSVMRRRAQLAGVTTPSLHSFRRAFALTSLRNGADVFSLQRLMGHADLTMLRRYLRQTSTDLREAHRKTGPVDNAL